MFVSIKSTGALQLALGMGREDRDSCAHGLHQARLFLRLVPAPCRWNEVPDLADPINAAHHRDILSISAEDPMQLVPGGVPCIRVRRITHSVSVCRSALGLQSMSCCLATI